MADQTPDDAGQLGAILKAARLLKGWTQDQAASEAGLTRQYVVELESGRVKSPRPRLLGPLVTALGADWDEVFAAMGFFTRDERGLPPKPSTVAPVVHRIARLLESPMVPDEAKQLLAIGVQAALDLWYNALRIQAPTEPGFPRVASDKPYGKTD